MGEENLSIVYGGPLSDEPLMGALTIGGYLRDVAERHGDAEALVLNGGGERISWSYNHLLAQSMAVAKALIASGEAPGSRIGILMSNRPEFLALLFGSALAGCVPVALSTFSTESELDFLLPASAVSLVVYEGRVAGKDFAAILGRAPDAQRWPALREAVALGPQYQGFLSRGAEIAEHLVLARADAVSPDDPGGIFFSSGTTSLPKGIVHSHKAFAIQWWRWPRVFAMREPVRSWTGNGFFWSGNVSMIVGTAFSSGGAVVLQPWFEEEEALRLIGEERVSFLAGRPHQWARLEAAQGWSAADLSSLRYVTRGEILKRHPTASFDWEEPMSFGTTETMTICTSFGRDVSAEHYQGSCGPPLPGNWLKIVDPLTGAPVPRGDRGEMCIKGPTLMMTYLGKNQDQCLDHDGYYCTGDGGYVDGDGRFFWEGRLTDMIKTGGANVSPEEVDAVIARFHGIKRTQTVGVPDDLLGEMVVACVVPVEGCEIDEKELVAFLKRDLASFKLPRRVLIFTDEDFAVTGSGKAKASDIREKAVPRLKA
ncbi:MAG: class I adenylate-forming enzyme family protein [Novosphingobium sp.]